MESKANTMKPPEMEKMQTGKALSPILQKKRLPRKHLLKRSSHKEEQQVDIQPCKIRNSGIPVCVKDHITPQNTIKTMHSSKLLSTDKNAKKPRHDKSHKIPELVSINTPINEKTKPHKLSAMDNIKSHSKPLELECLPCVKHELAEGTENNFPNGQSTIANISNMDMLYHNNKFEKTAASGTTTFASTESEDIHGPREFHNSSAEVNMFRTPEGMLPHDCIKEEEAVRDYEDCESQLNYDSLDETFENYITNESSADNNIKLDVQTDEGKNQKFVDDPFRGFQNEEIKDIEDNLNTRREYKIMKLDFDLEANELSKSNNEQSHNKMIINGPDPDNHEEIPITPNNHVMIRIIDNYLKIEIEKEPKDKTSADLAAITNTEQANDNTTEALEMGSEVFSHEQSNDLIQKDCDYSEVVKDNRTTLNEDAICLGGFKSASGSDIKINSKCLKTATFMYKNLNMESQTSSIKKNPAQTSISTKTESKLYTDLSEAESHCQSGFQFRHGHRHNYHSGQYRQESEVVSPNSCITEAESAAFGPSSKGGFSSASGKAINVDIDKLKMIASKFEEFGDLKTSNCSQDHKEVISNPFKKPKRGAPESVSDNMGTFEKSLNYNNFRGIAKNSSLNTSTPIRTGIKKRLGVSRIKCNDISKEQLEKARLLFEDCDKSLPHMPGNKTKFSNIGSPSRGPSKSFSEDSLILTSSPKEAFGYQKINAKPLPKKQPVLTERISPQKGITSVYDNKDSILVFHEKSCSNFEELQNDIDIEYMNLKRKLDILTERKQAIELQRHLVEGSERENRKPKLGILMRRKMNAACRVHLFELKFSSNDHFNYFNVDDKVFEITPKNADKMHFNSNSMEYRATLKTLDGANVIPNTKNTIGATEISNAFQAMDGVDPRLIPKGWVLNHYKWIVWKLASYERRLPQYFKNYLSVDSIMQQLKYRYDKEIDQAQRSALRKILEKDDVPNKRIVLCVADIVQVYANNFELLLTDGWYAIKTIIDSMLSQQIRNNTIAIGTKLMIQGAELINGDGCHPLETPDHTKLKIGFNSTRRAAWHVKLGFYKNVFPFPIPLNTINVNGGNVPCVKVYIIRAYPLRYMETYNGTKIWRNSKAEEKHARDFDMECMRELEKIKLNVMDEYEHELCKKTNKKWNKQSISGITCPKTLYQIMEGANDPEYVYNLLNSHQKSLVMDYKLNATSDRQREIAQKISMQVNMINRTKREVTPVKRLLVTDSLKESKTCIVINIWRPSEDQLHMFKEGSCISIFNLTMRKTNELNTTFKTLYKVHNNCTLKTYERQVLPIAMTTDTYYKPMFNEFDTIGIIMDIQINTFDQELWLADIVGRLLFVKIVDGPKICSLIDRQKIGQVVALSNLILQSPHPKFGQAIASQYTIVTQYPEEKYLQNGLEIFNCQLKNTTKLIRECKQSIESLRSYVNLKHYSDRKDFTLNHQFQYSTRSEDLDENTSIPSELTITDVAMSLIDTDQFM